MGDKPDWQDKVIFVIIITLAIVLIFLTSIGVIWLSFLPCWSWRITYKVKRTTPRSSMTQKTSAKKLWTEAWCCLCMTNYTICTATIQWCVVMWQKKYLKEDIIGRCYIMRPIMDIMIYWYISLSSYKMIKINLTFSTCKQRKGKHLCFAQYFLVI